MESLLNVLAARNQVHKWGKTTFAQFDTNSDGQLSTAELINALKALPRKKPKSMPKGAKFMSVDVRGPPQMLTLPCSPGT